MKPTLSVILPAYNEAPNVESVVKGCKSACERHFSDYEIIVVNDGSEDSTGDMSRKLADGDAHVIPVDHDVNRGYGAALRSGFNKAEKEWMFFTDADGQFDPESMDDFIPLLASADIVAGYRNPRMDNLYRRLLGWLYSRLMTLFFRVGLRDVNCAFKFIRTDFIRNLRLTSDGAMINTEIMAQARKKGLRVVEKGVKHLPRKAGEQSGGSGRVIFKALKEYAALYSRLKKQP